MPLSAVVDASVLVSAFIFRQSLPGEVLKLADAGRYRLHLSEILIEETRRSLLNERLLKKYQHSSAAVSLYCHQLGGLAETIISELPAIEPVCRDPDDDHVIAAAMVSRSDYIVTGDKDLLALGQHKEIEIVTAREFYEALEGQA